jgi:hypothetical protein
MQSLRSLLAAAAMLASVGVASAAEPTVLTEEQLDGVTAGFNVASIINTVLQAVSVGGAGGGGGGAGGGPVNF